MQTQVQSRPVPLIVDDRPAHKCQHCGTIAPDVIPHAAYVGGKGFVTRHYCENPVQCWDRFDALYRKVQAEVQRG